MATLRIIEPDRKGGACSIGIVASRFNNDIVERLLSACLRTLEARGVSAEQVTVARVPGAFELPVVAAKMARSGKVDAVIALGALIRGETPHFDFIAAECVRGLGAVALETGRPVILGVLTVNHHGQALDRSGDDESNKGAEAAAAALDMISVLNKLGA